MFLTFDAENWKLKWLPRLRLSVSRPERLEPVPRERLLPRPLWKVP